MNDWIHIKAGLPDEPKKHDQLWVDVWANGERLADVNFLNGEFHSVIEDYQGDYSHLELIENVTHWMIPEPPINL